MECSFCFHHWVNSVIRKSITLLLVILFCFVLKVESKCHAGPYSPGEYALKAAFLYNFAQFIHWPTETFSKDQTTFTLCILGKDPFGPALDPVKGKSLKGRKLVIKHVDKLQDAENCQILFISRSEKENLAEILAELRGSGVLTVGDMENFAQQGGVINLITVKRKVRFEINLDAAERAGLRISSKLLKLAKIIQAKRKRESN